MSGNCDNSNIFSAFLDFSSFSPSVALAVGGIARVGRKFRKFVLNSVYFPSSCQFRPNPTGHSRNRLMNLYKCYTSAAAHHLQSRDDLFD